MTLIFGATSIGPGSAVDRSEIEADRSRREQVKGTLKSTRVEGEWEMIDKPKGNPLYRSALVDH
jgi:hypothetical protein